MGKISIVVIGGGAAGMAAAISASRKGSAVAICERMPRLGKKILASGNGRCNLLNDDISEKYYNASAGPLVKSVFSKFDKSAIINFFKELGLETCSQDGRVFPVTNQASSVLKVLEMELTRSAIPVEYNFEAAGISGSSGNFVVRSKSGKRIECEKIILAGGGKSYPALGSDGSCYILAGHLGHRIIEPVPAAVPLIVKDHLCHLLQGQRIPANAKAIIDGKVAGEARGELLFTKYGLSGTAILDISEVISIAINRNSRKDVLVSVDMVPFMSEEQLTAEIARRQKKGMPKEEILIGILPNKFTQVLKDFSRLKDMRFKAAGTRGWNEAEFTAGGIDVNEITPETLESKLKKGIYLAGEMVDVNGVRGGYNLAWAWASGFVAGLTA